MRVFISWSGADRDVKNVIAETLSQENIPYWDSDEDCVTDFSQECIENIRRSQIYLIIVSEASMSPKSYVINELIEARRKPRMRGARGQRSAVPKRGCRESCCRH